MFNIFSDDFKTEKEANIVENKPICEFSGIISANVSKEAIHKGESFAQEISDCFVQDFEKSEKLIAKIMLASSMEGNVVFDPFQVPGQRVQQQKN